MRPTVCDFSGLSLGRWINASRPNFITTLAPLSLTNTESMVGSRPGRGRSRPENEGDHAKDQDQDIDAYFSRKSDA